MPRVPRSGRGLTPRRYRRAQEPGAEDPRRAPSSKRSVSSGDGGASSRWTTKLSAKGVAGFRDSSSATSTSRSRRLFKALAGRIDLFIGMPAGPLHLTMARGGVPRSDSGSLTIPTGTTSRIPPRFHLIGSTCATAASSARPASATKPPLARHRPSTYIDTPAIAAARSARRGPGVVT